jgi:hypothetical protein
MAKFLLLMEGLGADPSATDETTRAYNQKWMDWIGSLIKAGTLESGLPLQPVAKEVTKDAVTDRPLQTVDIYGYMVVKAESLDEVVEIVRQAPHTELGGMTIIRPALDVPMG